MDDDFDPKAYLAEKTQDDGFDPKAYLAEKEPSQIPETDRAAAEASLLAPPKPAPPPQPGWFERHGFDPKLASESGASIIPRLKEFWDKHVTQGDTTAGREEEQLAKFYPEDVKEADYQKAAKFITSAHPPAWINPIYQYGRGLQAIGLTKTGAAFKGVGEAEVKFATPMNVALGAVAPEGRLAEAVLGGTFLGQAIYGTPSKWRELKQARDKGDTQKAYEIAVEMGASYLPGVGLLGLAGIKTPLKPEPETIIPQKMSKDQFTEAAQMRLEELSSKKKLTPVEEAERDQMVEHLSEGGSIEDLAVKSGVQLEEPKPPQTIEATVGDSLESLIRERDELLKPKVIGSKANQRIIELNTKIQELQGGETDASTIGSTAEVPLRDQGTGVGEEAPLRQQGEVAGTQEPESVSTSESVAAAPQEVSHGEGVTPVEEKIQEDEGQGREGVLTPEEEQANLEAAPEKGEPAPTPEEATELPPKVREAISLDEIRLMREKSELQLQRDIAKRATGASHPAIDDRINQIDDELERIANESMQKEGLPPEPAAAPEPIKTGAEPEAAAPVRSKKKGKGAKVSDRMDIQGISVPPQELFDQGQKLRLRSEKEGGYVNADILKDVMDFGRRVFTRGMDFARWAGEMVKHLGDAVKEHLQGVWRSITGQNILPHARERGSVPLPQRKRGEAARTPQEKQLDVFKAEAKQKGFEPTAKLYNYWKSHLESLPEQGETLQQHEARTPQMDVSEENYKNALARNQIMAASQIKRAALKRGVTFEPPAPTPKKAGKAQKTLSSDTVPSQRPGGIDKWNVEKDEAPPVVDENTGGTKEPPPPGSTFGPTPDGTDPGREWAGRIFTKARDYWEHYWPRESKMMKEDEVTGSKLINAHQHMIDRSRDYWMDLLNEPSYLDMMNLKHDFDHIVDAEHMAITDYQDNLDQGMHPDEAWEEAVFKNPLKEVFLEERKGRERENEAADKLGVPRPKRVDDPYLPRVTNEDGKAIERLGYHEPGIGGQIRKSIGIFDQTRTHRTMKDGIDKDVQYDSSVGAWLMRKKVGVLLRATADTVQEMLDNGALHESERGAKNASKDGKTAYRISGLGGKDYWVASRQQAVFMRHNFQNPGSAWSKMNQMLNLYVRNPNLINPLPHITKNMAFKMVLRLFNNAFVKKEIQGLREYRDPELIEKFGELGGWPRGAERLPQMMAKAREGLWIKQHPPEGTFARRAAEAALYAEKGLKGALRSNNFSQKYIFQKADPAMLYMVWKSYVKKGMDPEVAMAHSRIDMVRYDSNSGGMNFWKNWPGNFFVPWRTGTYVTLFRSMRDHPISTILVIGALEYMREMALRKGKYLPWTHLPIDYLEAPLAEAVDAFSKAHKAVQLGRGPVKAYAGAALDTAKIAATTAVFGPGGAQAPDSMINMLKSFGHGTAADRARAMNMFWGISQIANVPQEFMAAKRDGDWAGHMKMVLGSIFFGTHSAIQYEPRRLGALIPESWPGMAKSPEYLRAEALRGKRDTKSIKAETKFEQRHGVTAGFYQGPEESQWSNLQRAAGARTKKATTFPGH